MEVEAERGGVCKIVAKEGLEVRLGKTPGPGNLEGPGRPLREVTIPAPVRRTPKQDSKRRRPTTQVAASLGRGDALGAGTKGRKI